MSKETKFDSNKVYIIGEDDPDSDYRSLFDLLKVAFKNKSAAINFATAHDTDFPGGQSTNYVGKITFLNGIGSLYALSAEKPLVDSYICTFYENHASIAFNWRKINTSVM